MEQMGEVLCLVRSPLLAAAGEHRILAVMEVLVVLAVVLLVTVVHSQVVQEIHQALLHLKETKEEIFQTFLRILVRGVVAGLLRQG